jgi:O-antigen ligase
MLKVIEASLMLCITAAVLAFGGTEPISLAMIEVLLLGTAAAALYGLKNLESRSSWQAAWVPAALVGLVALQLVPLPVRAAEWLRPNHPGWNVITSGSQTTHFSSLSIAPYYTRTHLLVLACCVVVYFFARSLGQQRGSRRRLMGWLLILGGFEALYGLLQYLSGWQQIFAYVKKYNLEEATGTYINRNHYAGLLEMIIPFGIALLLYEHSKLSRLGLSAARWKAILVRGGLSRMGLGLFAVIVMLAALLSSRSRMGIIAAVSSFAVMSVFSGFQRRAGAWLGALIMICVTVLVLWIGAGSALGRFGSISNEYLSSNDSRLSLWRDTARLVGAHPLIGSGLGTFPVAFTAVQTTFLGKFVNHAHNDYLELASDLGIPAALLFFGSVVLLLTNLAKRAVSSEAGFEKAVALGCLGSIAAILLHSLTDFNLYIPANALLFSLILGLAAAICAAGPARSRPEHEA